MLYAFPMPFEPSGRSSSELFAVAEDLFLQHSGGVDPLIVEHARGSTVTDRDGRSYLDFTSGQLCATFGHNPDELRNAMVDAFERSIHINSYLLSEEVIRLGEELVELLPDELSKVVFLNTGSEATEVALKAAKMASGRWESIGVSRSYHGHTAGAAGVTFLPRRKGTGPAPPGVHALPAPYCFRCPLGSALPDCGFACVDVGMASADAQRTGDVAACIIEPVMSTGGMLDLPEGYLAHLRSACDERGIALVLDEAQTGLGRTGPMFAFETDGTVPDAIALSKTLGGGFPLSAVVMTDAIAGGAAENGFRFLTSHMNEPSMALIGLAMLELARHHVAAATATTRGAQLRTRLEEIAERHHGVGDVRGRGLLLGMEFVDEDGSPAPELAREATRRCRAAGLLVQVVSDNVWRIAPPLTVNDAEIDQAATIIENALSP